MENKNHRKVIFEYDECLVGQSVSCLAYAYMHNIPVFGLAQYKPLRFDYIDVGIDLSPIMLENEKNVLKMLDGQTSVVGMDKIKLWHILCSHLSYAGLLPCFGMYESIKVKDNKMISFSYNNREVNVNSECFIFFDVMDDNLFEVNDYININKDGNIPIDYYEAGVDDWPFFKQIFFYDSERVAGNHKNKKDICAKSLLNVHQVDNFEYSETAMRFKVADFIDVHLNKNSSISLNQRIIRPSFESVFRLEEIMNLNVEMDELRRLLYKHYINSPCDIK